MIDCRRRASDGPSFSARLFRRRPSTHRVNADCATLLDKIRQGIRAWRADADAGVGECASAASTAAVSGVVRDAQGVAQMGAMVQVLAAGSVSVATAFTDMYGRYRIANLVPGSYQVRATAALFVPATRRNLRLATGMRATVNLTLSMLSDPAAWLPARAAQAGRARRRLDVDAALGGEPADSAHAGRWRGGDGRGAAELRRQDGRRGEGAGFGERRGWWVWRGRGADGGGAGPGDGERRGCGAAGRALRAMRCRRRRPSTRGGCGV